MKQILSAVALLDASLVLGIRCPARAVVGALSTATGTSTVKMLLLFSAMMVAAAATELGAFPGHEHSSSRVWC